MEKDKKTGFILNDDDGSLDDVYVRGQKPKKEDLEEDDTFTIQT